MSTTILLADDSPTIAKILGMSLQSEDYVIRSVLTAEEALKELKNHAPDLFLVDLSLPEKNGYEFARLVKSDTKLKSVRVILLASAFEPMDEAEYHACGADGTIKKPFDPTELRTKLRAVQEAPPRFPDGSKVTGSLSGFLVSSPEDSTAANILAPSAAAPSTAVHDTLSDILHVGAAPSGADADSILAGLMGSPEPASELKSAPAEDAPPPFKGLVPAPSGFTPEKSDRAEFTNATVAIDLSGNPEFGQPVPDAYDISKSFSTPPGGTAIIDLLNVAQEAPPAAAPAAPAAAAPAPKDDALSANAQALAAFFEAEISSKVDTPAPAPVAPAAAPKPIAPAPKAAEPASDAFDASLGSIEWDSGPASAKLDEWSSSPPKAAAKTGPISNDSPPPFQAAAKPSSAPSRGGTPGGSLMFDTGGSSFRFSEDYIHRISKSFTGAINETVPTAAHGMFPQQSDDRPTAKPGAASEPSTNAGGGAWSQGDVARIEKIVREEVQMVVREVAEKIAWEVIPELAENLIKKELEKVMKEMGQ